MFGQLVIGPPGSGKTTYCFAMKAYLEQQGRPVAVVNLDPGNDRLPYRCALDIAELIRVDEVMATRQLGPNGALVYCMDFLEANIDWLRRGIDRAAADTLREFSAASVARGNGSSGAAVSAKAPTSCYFLFDCPGQVELYTHHTAMARISEALTLGRSRDGDVEGQSPPGVGNGGVPPAKNPQVATGEPAAEELPPPSPLMRLSATHLVDAHYCADPAKFVAVLTTSLSVMLQLALPHINVLAKTDLVQQFGRLPFGLDYFTEVLDLERLVDMLADDPILKKFKKFNRALVGLVEDTGLVSFIPMTVKDTESVARVAARADAATGYIYGGDDAARRGLAEVAATCGVPASRLAVAGAGSGGSGGPGGPSSAAAAGGLAAGPDLVSALHERYVSADDGDKPDVVVDFLQ